MKIGTRGSINDLNVRFDRELSVAEHMIRKPLALGGFCPFYYFGMRFTALTAFINSGGLKKKDPNGRFFLNEEFGSVLSMERVSTIP